MSRLLRYTQQIFGSSAATDQMAEYGSLAAGTPLRYSGSTITPAIVQGLSEYLSGWFSATIGVNSPAIEDMNSLCYLYAYQLAYSFQIGVPEWDSATTYYIGSIAQDSAGTLYSSKTNTNLNNPLVNGSDWQSPNLPGIITPNAVPYSAGMTLNANQSLMWPYMQIRSGQTVIVPSNAQLIGISSIVLTGTAILQATGTGIIKII